MARKARVSSETKKAASLLYYGLLDELAKFGGRTHSSIRESAVDYGRIAGKRDKTIFRDLLATGVNTEDAKASL